METYAFNMETLLHNEMDATNNAKYQLWEKEEKIDCRRNLETVAMGRLIGGARRW
jgi:hypothetical protein